MVVGGGAGQLGGGADGGAQGGDDGVAAVTDGHVRGIGDGVDRGGALPAPVFRRHGDVAAVRGGGEDVALQLPGGGVQIIVPLHGDEVGVHRGGGDLHRAAGKDVVVLRLDIEVAQLAGGLTVGHQEQVVGHRPLAAVGGAVDGGGGGVVRRRHGDGGGAAAVQADGGHTAQLDHPLGHLGQAGTDGVAGPPAVDGVEHHVAVSGHAHRGAGAGAGGQAGGHGPVFHQGVQGAHGVLDVVPRLIRGGGRHGDLTAHGDVPQGVGIVGVGETVGGEDHLVPADGGGGGGLDHLVRPQGEGAADGEGAVHDGAQHVHTGLRVAGGVTVIEVICIEVDTAGGDPGLVDAGDGTDDLRGVSGAVRALIAQIGGDGDAGLADDGGAVLPESDGVVSGIAAEELAVRYQDADGQAVGGVEEVAVDAGHHPVPLPLQLPGRGGHRGAGGQRAAVGDDGGHIVVGGIGDDIFRPQVGVSGAPEHVGGELGLPVQQGVLGGQVLAQSLRRGGGEAQGAQERERQKQGQGLAQGLFHVVPPSAVEMVYIILLRIAQAGKKVNPKPATNFS